MKNFSFENGIFEAGNIRMDFKVIHPMIWLLLGLILFCMIFPTADDPRIKMESAPLWYYPIYFGAISVYLILKTPSKK
ncbi:MAG: hypothetical protein WCI91_03005 [Candidatus Nomurabacteria bacterium]